MYLLKCIRPFLCVVNIILDVYHFYGLPTSYLDYQLLPIVICFSLLVFLCRLCSLYQALSNLWGIGGGSKFFSMDLNLGIYNNLGVYNLVSRLWGRFRGLYLFYFVLLMRLMCDKIHY